VYDLEQIGIRTKDFIVSSPSPIHFTEEIEGMDGLIDLGSTEGARSIECSFRAEATDRDDFVLMRNEIFKIFRSKEAFYLIDSREPSKRWEVKSSNAYDIGQKFVFGDFTIDFTCYKGYAESIGTTEDPFTFDSDLWQFDQGLILEDLIYTYSETSFSIYNAGDVTVNPRDFPLLITYTGASTNLSIKNTTTGDEWTHTGTSNPSDIIRLDGIRSTKNSLSIFRDTNRKLISLAPGWNDFELTGATSPFEISFDFRFYYF
jgi:phage-related protein